MPETAMEHKDPEDAGELAAADRARTSFFSTEYSSAALAGRAPLNRTRDSGSSYGLCRERSGPAMVPH